MNAAKRLGKIAVCLLVLLDASPLFAGSGIGFIVRTDGFSLAVRFGFAEPDEVSRSDAEEISNAGGLLFECMKWVRAHEDSLGRTKADITVFWDLPGRQFDVQVNDDLKAQNVAHRKWQTHTGLFEALTKLQKLPGTKTAGPDTVPLSIIRSKEYVDKQFERSDIFFGAIPGSMYSNTEEKCVVFLLSLDKQAEWVKGLWEKGATVGHVNADRNTMKELLGSVE